MKFKMFIPLMKRNQPGFNIPFGYGFGYKAINSFGSYYYPVPFNYLARLFYRFAILRAKWFYYFLHFAFKKGWWHIDESDMSLMTNKEMIKYVWRNRGAKKKKKA